MHEVGTLACTFSFLILSKPLASILEAVWHLVINKNNQRALITFTFHVGFIKLKWCTNLYKCN